MGAASCGDCDSDLVALGAEKCDDVQYGTQIVRIFVQKLSGTQFDGSVGNDVNEEADWDTKLAATGDDKIVIIGGVTATLPSVDPVVQSGQDVPYGGEEAIEATPSITGHIRYVNSQAFENSEVHTYCQGAARIWYLDNRGYLWGGETIAKATIGNGFDDVSLIFSTLDKPGIGGKVRIPFRATWTSQCQPKPIAQIPFLKTIQAA